MRDQVYIVLFKNNIMEMWDRESRSFVWFFHSNNPPYTSLARANAVIKKQQKARIMPMDPDIEAMTTKEMAIRFPDRFF